MTNTDLPSRIHVLAKPTGSTCNLNCDYCFYLKKESLYPGSRFRMSDEVLEAYLSQLIAAHRTDTVTVAWQGGEPTLMGLDFFRHAVELQNKHRRPGMRFENTLQTNGTLLTDDWCAFLRENNFLVGISIDGPRRIHDVYRKDKGGRPTFKRVLHGLRLLQRHGVETNVLVTVNRINAASPLEVYRFLRDEERVSWIQFIPAIERMHAGVVSPHQEGTSVSARSVTPEQWGNFLTAIFDEWVRNDVGRLFVQTFEAAVRSWLGLGSSGMCIFDPTCGHGLALEHNGDIYACDHFVEPSHLLGNILKTPMADLATSERQLRFGRAKLESLPRLCRECSVRFACHGECPKNRFLTTPEGEPGLNYLCAGYKRFFEHADAPLKLLAELLRRGRPAAQVMNLLAQAEERPRSVSGKISRNASCPCGSGLKYKRCHGQNRTPSTQNN
ncbi:MAG: anaerobic sulfatase maturase [Deltaproteobacteria bacterium]|nr:MAG: anaerobic sulfatase maturase [Deltaproteobacteria bacterium]